MTRFSGVWSSEESAGFLEETVVPLRLACASSSGWPLVLSLWYVWRDGSLWCATQASSQVAGYVAQDSRCAFEVATNVPPYKGVRGQGRAVLDAERGEEILRALIARYLGDEESKFARWLLRRTENEVAIRIDPLWVASWDFTARMSDALPARHEGS